MSDFQLTTPVALFIFNRPDTTARVFAEIARARPATLLIIGDGPRSSHAGEAERVRSVRAITEAVDWPCDVRTNYSATNLGCRQRVTSGIDWVFGQFEEAIIMEDDCLPDPTFFRYCQEMLARFRHDQRISMVSGNNFQFGRRYGADSYYFSKYGHIWGWATWRDRWQGSYDGAMSNWPLIRDANRVADLVRDEAEVGYWSALLEGAYQGGHSIWDYRWSFANWLAGRLSVLPATNLISNIGFGPDATHTAGATHLANLPTVPMQFPLVHPVAQIRNRAADHFTFEQCFQRPLRSRIRQRIINLLQRITR